MNILLIVTPQMIVTTSWRLTSAFPLSFGFSPLRIFTGIALLPAGVYSRERDTWLPQITQMLWFLRVLFFHFGRLMGVTAQMLSISRVV